MALPSALRAPSLPATARYPAPPPPLLPLPPLRLLPVYPARSSENVRPAMRGLLLLPGEARPSEAVFAPKLPGSGDALPRPEAEAEA